MTEPGSRLERFFERAAGLGASPALHPARLMQAVEEAARESRRDGSMANAYRLTLTSRDAAFFEEQRREFEGAIVELLGAVATELRATPPAAWLIEVVEGEVAGGLGVSASFRNAVAAGASPAPAGATTAIQRHAGKFLVVEGYGRVPLTHTPFVVGRGRECDLTIPDLAISRRHARIEAGPDGRLLMRDMSSRNQLVVHGGKLAEVALAPGLVVELGGTKLWLEVAE